MARQEIYNFNQKIITNSTLKIATMLQYYGAASEGIPRHNFEAQQFYVEFLYEYV